MRIAAAIILITLGVLFLWGVIFGLFVVGIVFGIRMFPIAVRSSVFLLGLVVGTAFDISGGICCLTRKYWRVCLASASFAVFYLAFCFASYLGWSEFLWGSLWSDYIRGGWPIWVMLVAAVISVIFIVRKKKEWQEVSDSVDGKVSYGG